MRAARGGARRLGEGGGGGEGDGRDTCRRRTLNIAPIPSSRTILTAQSSVPLYSHWSGGFSACICRRRRTVSNG